MTIDREQILALAGEPVAYLRFWAMQIYSGHGNIECDEGFEVTTCMEPGVDGSPAFPVFTADQVLAATKPLEDELAQAKDELAMALRVGADIRQQLAEKDTELSNYKRATDLAYKGSELETRQQLAAAQLQITQYREDADLLIEAWNFGQFADDFNQPQAKPVRATLRRLCHALNQSADTSALEALVVKAGEVMRERCDRKAESMERDYPITGKLYAGNVSKAIRTLPSVTLADMQRENP